MEKRRSTGPRIGPRITAAQPAPPPTHVQIGNDRVLAGAREVDIAQIRPDPDQPRRFMDPTRLEELATSIRQHGLLQPLVVRQEGLAANGDMRYVIIAGGRRFAALSLLVEQAPDEGTRARLRRVMVVINESEAAERRILQLIENIQREDLSPVEEARTLKEIMRVEGLSTVQLAARVHRSQGYVDERLRLLRHEVIEAAVEAGTLTKSAGAAIASLPTPEARAEWLARAAAGETIRPREVYATKAPPRPGLPKFGNASAAQPHPTAAGTPDGAVPNSGNHTVNPVAERLPKFGSDTTRTDEQGMETLPALMAQLDCLTIPATRSGRTRLRRELTEMRAAIDRLLDALHEPDRANIAARSDDSA